jgi:hypothetical protein
MPSFNSSFTGGGQTLALTGLEVGGTVTLREQADADADAATYGQLWVNTATPNELYFTTDAGDDIQLTSGTSNAAGGGAAANTADTILHMQVFA